MRIRIIPNMMEKKGRKTIEIPYSRENSVEDYLKEVDLRGQRIIVSGREQKDLKAKLKPTDEIIVTPEVNDIIGIIVAGIKAIVSAAIAHPWYAAAFVLSTAYSVYSFVTRPRMPSFNPTSPGGIDQGSATYSWDGGNTIQEVGTPVPLGYGEHKVWGNIVNSYQTTDGDKNYVHLLLLLGEGEIDSVSDVCINDNPIENYDGVSYEVRYGTNDQSVITGFDDLHDVHGLSVNLLKDDSYTYTTVRDNVQALEIYLQLNGLFQQDELGSQQAWSVSYRVRYRLVGGDWVDDGITTINANHRTEFKRIKRIEGLTAGQYEVEITRTSADSTTTKVGDLSLVGVDEIRNESIAYVNCALLAVKALATNQLQGQVSSLNISCIAKLKKVLVPQIMYGGYEVDWGDYYWDPTAEVYKRIADDAVCSWDGTTYVKRFCANPVWCRKDLYLSQRYGLGEYMSSDDLDSDVYLAMSRYCEELVDDGEEGYEKRFRLDVYLDSKTNVMDLLTQLDTIFRAMTFTSLGKFVTCIDKPQDTSSQLFGVGNILDDSFSQQWVSPDEKYNVIEVQFNDMDKNYQMDTLLVIDQSSLDAGDEPNVKKFRFFGRKASYAVREAQYMLRVAKNVDRSVKFNSHMNAIASQPGDRVDVSHDVPQIGFSGRVLSGSTSEVVKLDRTVVIEEGITYKLRVAFGVDDLIEEREVIDTPGSYTEVEVDSAFTYPPAFGDNYAFGQENILVEPMRLIDVQRDNSEKVKLSMVPYNDAVYTEGTVVIPSTRYSSIDSTFPVVENLSLSELVLRANDGTIYNTINVWFNRPDQSSGAVRVYDKSRIYISDDDGDSWSLVGETNGLSFTILDNIVTGTTYKIAVVTVTKASAENTIADSPQEEITILGKAAKPSKVQNFDVQQRGSQLRGSWDAIPDGDRSHYTIKKGSEWSTGDMIAEKIDVTEFEWPVGTIGEETYMIKSVDTSGNESEEPAMDTLTVTAPPEMNFAIELNPWSANREYLLSGISRIQSNLFDPSYARDVFQLDTDETWPEKEAEGKSWDEMVSDSEFAEGVCVSTGYIEQAVADAFDLESIFTFNLVSDLDYKNVDGGSITLQVSTSEDGTTWTDFANVSSLTDYRARYIRFKYILATTDTSHNVQFYAGTIYVTASIVTVDWGRDLAISAGGTTITFGQDFVTSPRVTSLIIVSGDAIGYKIVSISATEMEIKLIDINGDFVAGEINFEVKGEATT